jgi:hypothetical protein
MTIVIVLVIVLVMYFSPSYVKTVQVTESGPFDLSSPKTAVAFSNAKALLEPQFTAQAFVYLNPMMKTGSHVDCGTDPTKPSCQDGSFQPCLCDMTGCDKCLNRGYFTIIDLMGMAVLEVMPVPDASRQGAMATHLYVKTEMMNTSGPGPARNYYIETIQLPPTPVQKWVMITIARDGRQFDIYYDNALVKSQKTMFMPISTITQTNLTGILSGSKGLMGHIANITVYSNRLTVLDVENKYKTLADTRGSPYLDSKGAATLSSMDGYGMDGVQPSYGYRFNFKMPTFDFCFLGNCKAPAVTPASNKIWVSNYA